MAQRACTETCRIINELLIYGIKLLSRQCSHACGNTFKYNCQEVDNGLATEVCAEGRPKEDGKSLCSEDKGWLVKYKALEDGEAP